MSEIRSATPEEIESFGFPEFGESKVNTVWNEEATVSFNRYGSNQVAVENVFDYRDTPPEFLRQLANDSVKIMATRASLDLLAAGNTSLMIPVEEDVLRPGRTGGRTSLSLGKLISLVTKAQAGEASEEELELLEANSEKVQELKAIL